MVTATLATDEVKTMLEWAGMKLLAMGTKSPAPKEPGIAWPAYVSENPDTKTNMRAPIPGKAEITLMDEILLLPALVSDVQIRRVLHTRALVSPLAQRYLYSWEKIGTLLHMDRKSVARLHAKGLRSIAAKLSAEKSQSLRNSFHAITH